MNGGLHMLRSRLVVILLSVLICTLILPRIIGAASAELVFRGQGHTHLGDWEASGVISAGDWRPGMPLGINATLYMRESHFASLPPKAKLDGFCMLVTAERTFDAGGRLRLPSDEKMSTLLTPTGLAIEGGVQGAVTNRFGYGFRTPVDEMIGVPLAKMRTVNGRREVSFAVQTRLPSDLPPGIYRIRLDFGVRSKNRYADLNGEAFAKRPFFKGEPTSSYLYSPIIPADGVDVAGKQVKAAEIKPRVPWVILAAYNSNGYSGVVADEDQADFALSPRNIIPDDVILPLYGGNGKKLAYSLEPIFPADAIDPFAKIAWDPTKGELAIQVTGPDGKTTGLGTAPFVAQKGLGLTTKRKAFTAWTPPSYGRYTVKASGWAMDPQGHRYEGGGTYHFWIAKRMTMATATFQGMAYPVGSKYGRDIGFAPSVPADVTVDAVLYPNSDPGQARRVGYAGKASAGGIFGAAQGMKPLALDAPGEYHAKITATYTDWEGALWVCAMRHAGVVYPEDTPIIARGKKVAVGGQLSDRGETRLEGYKDHLVHLNYPFQSGDVLLIASEGEGSNKIEPVLNYENKENPTPYDPSLQTIGRSNLRFATSNGYSPHLFPEYITDRAYYYAGGPRPGMMSRFLVAEDGTRAPYWPTSNSNFGGQINASNNGDQPGDIYRLIGGVVIRPKNSGPLYAGYLSSAFILPKGTGNNRIIGPGEEDLPGSDGSRARFFLVGLRPGMVYEMGAVMTPVAQIDPLVPATVAWTMTYPDGRQAATEGVGDRFGTAMGKDRWTLDQPGVYRYTIEGTWNGHQGYMPGLPKEGGEFYVIQKDRPADAKGLLLNLPVDTVFDPLKGLQISGESSAKTVYYAAVIPGAVVAQGYLPVVDGKFSYFFDPKAVNKAAPTYEITNLRTGQAEIKDVVHLTFFSAETTAAGAVYHAFARVIIRGNTVLYVR